VNGEFVECQGTNVGLQDNHASKTWERFPTYREMYENCTIVISNLEITHFGSDYDLSFFENIREVHGYVLVAENLVSRLPLTSLRIIRGRTLFRLPTPSSLPPRNLSLFVADNMLNSSVGLRDLEMPSLIGE